MSLFFLLCDCTVTLFYLQNCKKELNDAKISPSASAALQILLKDLNFKKGLGLFLTCLLI